MIFLALLLAGCVRPAPWSLATISPIEPSSSPSILPAIELLPPSDERPRDEQRRSPQAASEVAGLLRAAIQPWLGPAGSGDQAKGPGVQLKLRLLRLGFDEDRGRAEVLLEASLLRHERPIWQGSASSQIEAQAPGPEGEGAAVRAAIVDVLHTIEGRLSAVLSLGHKELPARATQANPSIFLIERVSQDRDLLEVVYIEAATGTVLRHEAGALRDRGYARPGGWLLSRRTVEGLTLSGEAYESLARALSARYDLRTIDDAYRYHFFGKR